MDNQITNDTILLIVRNNGMIEPHPQLTAGAMLQIAEQIRQVVLSMPVMRQPNGKHPQPEAQPAEA